MGNNKMYPFTQLLMTALAAFYSKAPSLRRFLGGFFEYRGIHGVDSLLSALHTGPDAVNVSRRIPTDNHIRKQLDGLDPTAFYPAVWDLLGMISEESGSVYRYKGMSVLVPYLGCHFSSKKIRCPVCISRVFTPERREEDQIENFHSFAGITLYSPLADGGFPQLPPEFLYADDYPDVIPGFPYRASSRGAGPEPNAAEVLGRSLARTGSKFDMLDPLFILMGPFGNWESARALKGHPYILKLNELETERFHSEEKEISELASGAQPKLRSDGTSLFTASDLYSRNLGPLLFERGHMTDSSYVRLVECPSPSGADAPPDAGSENSPFSSDVVFTTLPSDFDRSGGIMRLLANVEAHDTVEALDSNGFGFLKKFGHGQQTLSEVFCMLNVLAINLDVLNMS
ncbi:MAG: hypothetical protein LBQ12_14820 [Deltaproteobacteria bacterium]|nr:hypothetical protein [Deltaproteobacteria bacterium]